MIGGAVYAEGNLILENSILKDNSADDCSGAVDVEGSKAEIYGCTFENNHAKDDGGALWAKGNANIQNTIIQDNRADDSAGAIYAGGNLILNDSSVSYSDCEDRRPIVCNGIMKLSNSDINPTNLYLLTLLIDSAPEGSTIDLFSDYATIKDKMILKVSKDLIIDGHGHTIDLAGSSKHDHYFKVTDGAVTFKNIKFINGYNKDDDDGGAILFKSSSPCTVINCSFENCWAENKGGAIAVTNGKTLTVKDSNFLNNKASDDAGGAIWIKKNAIIENCYFEGNEADGNGAAIYSQDKLTLSNCGFENNIVHGNKYFGVDVYILGDLTLSSSNDNKEKDNATKDDDDGEVINGENDISMEDIINATNYTIEKKSENEFIVTFFNNTKQTVYVLPISDLENFKNATRIISKESLPNDSEVILDFEDNLYLQLDSSASEVITLNKTKNIIIRGHGATIAINASDNGEKHLFNISQGVSLTMNNISIKGFNTAICNQGSCQFTNVTFEENRAKDKLGGAITNNSRLNCVNCFFIKNSAKSGDAIYNEQGSQSTLLYCIFKDNEASKSSKSDFDNNDEKNIHTSIGASCLVFNDDDIISSLSIKDLESYKSCMQMISHLNHVKILILNFAEGVTIDTYDVTNYINCTEAKNIYINGNGATVNVRNRDSSYEAHFSWI